MSDPVLPRDSLQLLRPELFANLLVAHTGIMSFLMAVQEARPQEHQYALQDAAAYVVASKEHFVCCSALVALEGELSATIEMASGVRLPAEMPASEFPRLAALVPDQPRYFPSRPLGDSEREILKESLLSVYRCSFTLIGELRFAAIVASDYDTNRVFLLARTRHQTWMNLVQRVGHWFLLMAKALSAFEGKTD